MFGKELYDEITLRGKRRLAGEDYIILERHVRATNPKTIVETGSMDGCSSMLFGLIAKEVGAKVFCIEPKPKKGWYENRDYYGLHNTLTLIRSANPWFNIDIIPKPIDFLFIDGNHEQRWALVDYHFLEPFVRVGGRIAFHDYNSKVYKHKIRAAIELILKTDSNVIKELEYNKTNDRGTIVFEKIGESNNKIL